MEDINVLKSENEKLNARLQKAITVFGEQKASITRLTEERDAANTEIQKLKERIAEFEKKEMDNSEQDTKFFEQLQEIEELKTKVAECKKTIEEEAARLEESNAKNSDLAKALEIAKQNYNELNQKCVNEISTLKEQIAIEKKKSDELNAANIQQKEQAQKLIKTARDFSNNLETQFNIFK